MAEDAVKFDGIALSEQIKKGWSQFIDELGGSRTFEQFITFLTKHVRQPDVRHQLGRRIRVLFTRRLPRADAEILLVRFYVKVLDAVADSYDRLSPVAFTALQGASNSQVVKFPTQEVLDGIYGKQT
jgi:phosphoenolpyruvate carboxylase